MQKKPLPSEHIPEGLPFLVELLRKRDPESVALCTLLDKPERRVTDVKAEYTGFQIPDEFVVGYFP